MKTRILLVIGLVLPQLAYTQEFSQAITGGPSGFQGIGQKGQVNVINKDEHFDDSARQKEKLIQSAFEKAIETYKTVLNDSDDNDLKRAMGPILCGKAKETFSSMDLTILILDKDDKLVNPTTYWVPSLIGGQKSFVTHIPRTFWDKINDQKVFDHLALHEVGHIMAGDLGTSNPSVDLFEGIHEEWVEHLIWKTIGEKKYEILVRQYLKEHFPKESENQITIYMELWMIKIRAKKN